MFSPEARAENSLPPSSPVSACFPPLGTKGIISILAVGFVVTMFYYAINIVYPTMIAVLFTDATTDFRYAILLTLPQNLGLLTGTLLLTYFGSKIGHFRWTF